MPNALPWTAGGGQNVRNKAEPGVGPVKTCDASYQLPKDVEQTVQRFKQTTKPREPPKSRVIWTQEEDLRLREAVRIHEGKNWKKVAETAFQNTKTDVQCLHRWQKVLNPKLVKGPWTKEEDQLVLKLVDQYGAKKWSVIASHIPGRIGKQCRERWHNHLNPEIRKGPWTQEEDDLLVALHEELHNSWAAIAKFMKNKGFNRTDNTIKNHWNSSMRKRLERSRARGVEATTEAHSARKGKRTGGGRVPKRKGDVQAPRNRRRRRCSGRKAKRKKEAEEAEEEKEEEKEKAEEIFASHEIIAFSSPPPPVLPYPLQFPSTGTAEYDQLLLHMPGSTNLVKPDAEIFDAEVNEPELEDEAVTTQELHDEPAADLMKAPRSVTPGRLGFAMPLTPSSHPRFALASPSLERVGCPSGSTVAPSAVPSNCIFSPLHNSAFSPLPSSTPVFQITSVRRSSLREFRRCSPASRKPTRKRKLLLLRPPEERAEEMVENENPSTPSTAHLRKRTRMCRERTEVLQTPPRFFSCHDLCSPTPTPLPNGSPSTFLISPLKSTRSMRPSSRRVVSSLPEEPPHGSPSS